MRLPKGKQLVAPVLISGNVAKDALFKVTVLDCMHQGDHFNVYRGEDENGLYVCLKAIRYRSEKKERFKSAKDYVLHRRNELMSEHRLLRTSHPSLPEPYAMLLLENDTAEDKRLFRSLPEWEDLKRQEPVLVEEYFSGHSVDQLTDKLTRFPLSRRLAIIDKVAKLCLYLHKSGYLVQNLHPDHLIIKPRTDDNIQFVGLHHACEMKNGRVDPDCPGYKNLSPVYGLKEIEEGYCLYDERVDIFQIGMLLYYLLTFHDPTQDHGWLKSARNSFELKQQTERLEKSISSFGRGASWLKELLFQLTDPNPEYRIPEMDTLISYLQAPPQTRPLFEIRKASQDSTEIYISNDLAGISKARVRIEKPGSPHIFRQECPPEGYLSLPSLGIGEIVCSVALVDEKQGLSWWERRSALVFPEINIHLKETLPPHKFAFCWDSHESLHHVHITAIDTRGNRIDLGNFETAEVELPSGDVSLPFYEAFRVECVPSFVTSKGTLNAPPKIFDVELFPEIPSPVYRMLEEGVLFEMNIPQKQSDLYIEVELLHNGWPRSAKTLESKTIKENKLISLLLSYDYLDIFETHHFSFRVLIDNIGWRTGPSVETSPHIPGISGIKGEEKDEAIRLTWAPVTHKQMDAYEIACEGETLVRTRENECLLKLPPRYLVGKDQVDLEIRAVYSNGTDRRSSSPSLFTVDVPHGSKMISPDVQVQVSPFFVMFHVHLDPYKNLLDHRALFQRIPVPEGKATTLSTLDLKASMELKDTSVEPGKTYRYSLSVEGMEVCLLDQQVKVPEIAVLSSLQHVGYEDLVWAIEISDETAFCIEGEIEIVRKTEGQKDKSHFFKWGEEEGIYDFEETDLVPGETYAYFLKIRFQDVPILYEQSMGSVTTKKFELQESVQAYHNRACMSWVPSPTGQIDSISIYDTKGRLISETRSDCITLHNLEPQRSYTFHLKYRYLSGRMVDGKSISFTTSSYQIEAEATDIGIDSFKLHWKIEDVSVSKKIREFHLEVSGEVGTHQLTASTRNVCLKQLYPSTTYSWRLYILFKSGSRVLGASGEVLTSLPEFKVHIEIGLVHKISWDYAPCEAIDRVEIHRDDVPLIQTTENEMYDSDFKGGQEISYQFYYVLKDNRRILASRQLVKSLSMANLFSALKIEPGIGSIKWDFEDLKSFKYFKYVELYQNDQVLFKRGSQVSSLVFRDMGSMDQEQSRYLGLSDDPMNFRLAVVGVAPTLAKCKKKWTLNIKGIRCYYADLPYCFSVTAEYCCVYFYWEYSDTDLLKEILLRRLDDGGIVYRGPNQSCTVVDDNQGKGLSPNRKYAYSIEMIYNNYRTLREIEVEMNQFDPSRLEIKTRMVGDVLEITWNNALETSIARIGWREVKSSGFLGKAFPSLLKRCLWADFYQGILTVPLTNREKNTYYQIVYEDAYGHTFDTPPQRLSPNYLV